MGGVERTFVRPLANQQLLSIYERIAPLHFPEDELKPLSTVKELLDKDSYLGLGLYRSGDLLGYALFLAVPNQDVILLDYYAILEEYRSLGVGSLFLQEMKQYFRQYKGIFIETEDPDCASDEQERLLRCRRDSFYYKNGAHPTDISCALFGVPFHILFLKTDTSTDSTLLLTECALRKRLETLYRFMLPEPYYSENVIWK